MAQNVIGVVITSSPGPISRPASARCKPAVAEFTATACGAPTYSLNSRSKRAARGPVVSQPDLNVSSYFGDLFFTDRWAMKGNETCHSFPTPAPNVLLMRSGSKLSGKKL